MMIAVYIIVVILAFILLNLCLYFLVFVRPSLKQPINQKLLCRYAHRGLHSDTVAENSIAAFELACQNGLGIELDVQAAKDGVVMVFHDYSLNRMTGLDKKLCELTAKELGELSLADGDQKIPTFEQVLSLVNGRVPLLVELKGESLDASLCPSVAKLLSAYKGDYCIESFNPLLIKQMRKYLPNAFYGQLYTNVCRDKKKRSILNILLSVMAFNFLAKPNFIAFNKHDRKSLPVRLATGLYKAPKFVWTINTQAELSLAEQNNESIIFENITIEK